MSNKTVYLIAPSGTGFIAFGSGCTLTIDACNLMALSPSGFGVYISGDGRDLQSAKSRLALWGSAIAAASDGSLLRWDEDTQSVTDELAQGDSVFADEPIDTQSGPVAVHDPPNLTGALNRSETWTGCEILRGAA